MLLGFLIRRFIYKPKGLATIRDDYYIYGMLFAILVTAYLVEGARMAVTEVNQDPYLAMFSPVGLLVARMLIGLGETTCCELHKVLWWVHFFLADESYRFDPLYQVAPPLYHTH